MKNSLKVLSFIFAVIMAACTKTTAVKPTEPVATETISYDATNNMLAFKDETVFEDHLTQLLAEKDKRVEAYIETLKSRKIVEEDAMLATAIKEGFDGEANFKAFESKYPTLLSFRKSIETQKTAWLSQDSLNPKTNPSKGLDLAMQTVLNAKMQVKIGGQIVDFTPVQTAAVSGVCVSSAWNSYTHFAAYNKKVIGTLWMYNGLISGHIKATTTAYKRFFNSNTWVQTLVNVRAKVNAGYVYKKDCTTKDNYWGANIYGFGSATAHIPFIIKDIRVSDFHQIWTSHEVVNTSWGNPYFDLYFN